MTQPVTYQIGVGASAVKFNGYEVPVGLVRQAPPAWRAGFEVGRDTRDNVFPFVIDSLDGGFLATSGFFPSREKTKVYYNQGIMVHIPRLATLPFASTAQATLDDIDISGFRAANKRVHGLMSTLGVSGQRFLAAIGKKVYIDTSTSNPALALSDDTLTNNVLSIANLKLNNVDYTAVSTDGTTDDTVGTTDVTGSNPFTGGTKLVTHAHADDGFFFMDYFPSLGGNGWNTFGGVLNQVNGIWAYSSAAVTLPLTSSTMLPVVYKDTKDIEGTTATSTTSATSPAEGAQGQRGDSTPNAEVGNKRTNSYWGKWSNASNITSSNDGYATATSTFTVTNSTGDFETINAATGVISDELVGTGFDFSAIPAGAIITGIQADVEAHESSAGDEIKWGAAYLLVNGSRVGINMADGTEVTSSTNTYKTFGGSTSRWGIQRLTGDQVRRGLSLGIQFIADEGASDNDGTTTNTGQINVDHMRLTLTWRMPGTQMTLPKGGFSPGKPPHRANRLAYVHPVTDEETTVLKPRIVTFIDLEYDTEGERLVGSTLQPPTQMGTVDDVSWYQGGLAISGGSAPGVGEAVKLIDDDNVTRDLGFPAVHGTAAVRVAMMWAQGAVLMAYVCHADSTDAQLWMYWNGKWNAFGALFSKTLGGAMSTQPLGWAEKTQNTYQKQAYCFYPSSTNTAVMRQFVPLDPMNADPFLVNTTQVKQDGPLYVETAEIEVLPSEANNALMALQMQSRRVDDNTSYGSVNIKINTAGDHAFTSSHVNETFDAAAECFVDRPLASSGDPGIAFNTLIHRITLDHQTGSAETPNALPFIDFLVSDHAPLEVLEIHLVTKDGPVAQMEDPVSMAKRLRALMNTKVAQAFQGAGRDIPVKFKYNFALKTGSLGVSGLRWEDMSKAVIMVEQTPGANR